jgi:hypothetical protein
LRFLAPTVRLQRHRYVDGLATWAPRDPRRYRESGKRIVDEGYVHSTDHLPKVASWRSAEEQDQPRKTHDHR